MVFSPQNVASLSQSVRDGAVLRVVEQVVVASMYGLGGDLGMSLQVKQTGVANYSSSCMLRYTVQKFLQQVRGIDGYYTN